ncbi:uncharacterized protein LOC108949269 [Ciona intestinalis]
MSSWKWFSAVLVVIAYCGGVKGQENLNEENMPQEIYKDLQNSNNLPGFESESKGVGNHVTNMPDAEILQKILYLLEEERMPSENDQRSETAAGNVATRQLHVPSILKRFSMPSVIKKGMMGPSIIKRIGPGPSFGKQQEKQVAEPAQRNHRMMLGPGILKRFGMIPSIIKKRRFMGPSIIKRDGAQEATDNSYNY